MRLRIEHVHLSSPADPASPSTVSQYSNGPRDRDTYGQAWVDPSSLLGGLERSRLLDMFPLRVEHTPNGRSFWHLA